MGLRGAKQDADQSQDGTGSFSDRPCYLGNL